MPSFIEDTTAKKLSTLLAGISDGSIALPDFQRDFVWKPDETEELIASAANSFPAGNLLRVRNTPQGLFACRAFQGSSALSPTDVPTFLVLDGQQRLTSIYQALYGVGSHRYFLRLEGLMDGSKGFDEALFSVKSTHRTARKLEDEAEQAESLIFPLSSVLQGSGGFSRWAQSIARRRGGSADQQMDLVDKLLNKVGDPWIRPIEGYEFPVTTLSAETPTEAICTIFETLNRRGVKLTVFELLTARYWPRDIKLREMWEQAKAGRQAIAEFEVDPYYLLQIISLAFRRTPSCKRGDVMNLEQDERYNGDFAARFKNEWDEAVKGLDAALGILRNGCGVQVKKWLPYSTMLIPLAALLVKNPLTSEDAALKRRKITRWFWCSVFAQRYESAPNSRAVDDFNQVHAWLNGGQTPPESVSAFSSSFRPEILRGVTPRQSALYRGVMCLILKEGAKDFFTDDKVSAELMSDRNIDDHHIFPKAYLKRESVEEKLRDCVLNRTLIGASTNRSIGDDSPSVYMGRIQHARTQDDEHPELFPDMLRSHFVSDSSSLLADDYDRFLAERQAALGEAIKTATG